MSLHRIFVYGTLKRGEPNYKMLIDRQNGESTFVGAARTCEKWPLVIASEYNLPFLLHAKGKGNTIVGEIFNVDDAMLAVLDEFEGHPRMYERLQRDVEIVEDDEDVDDDVHPETTAKKTTMSCWIYFLTKYKSEMLDLPYFDNYSSRGYHGLEYVASEDLKDPEAI